MTYKKVYHDNVRRSIRSETIYTLDQLDHELSVITCAAIDTMMDHNNDYFINQVLNDCLILYENEDDIPGDVYDAIMDEYYWKIMYELMKILKIKHRINGGDYDIIMEEGDPDED